MKLDLESRVNTCDGMELTPTRVVVDPRTQTVTHIVVEPQQEHAARRLLPFDELDVSTQLTIESAQLRERPLLEHPSYLRLGECPIADPGWAVGISEVSVTPYFEAHFGTGWYDDHYTLGWDQIPPTRSRSAEAASYDPPTARRSVASVASPATTRVT